MCGGGDEVDGGENKLPAVGVACPHVGQQWSSEWTTVIPGPHCGSPHCTCWEGQAYTNIQHEMIVWRREKKGNGEREYYLLTQQASPVESVGPTSKR